MSSEYRQHRGPLPAPETFREYAAIVPDGAERIMRMAEKEQEQRHLLEREQSRREDRQQDRADSGVKSATLIGVVSFTVAALFGALRYAIPGASLAGATLVSLTYTFIAGTAIAKENRLQDARETQPQSLPTKPIEE